MNPAYSVILFTTASGAGYGLLFLLGLVGLLHGRASSTAFAITALVVALALITIGLLSSTFHLGRPERAWRAFSQWRTSWLSREGIAAIMTYPIALDFGLFWSGLVERDWLIAPLGLLTSLFCALTVFCTGKIYSTLKTIPRWHHPLTVPGYLLFALATGACLLASFAIPFQRFQPFQAGIAVFALIACAALKQIYWSFTDTAPIVATMASATGLGQPGQVRQWEVPHTTTNFIQKEMGFVVARKHAVFLRKLVEMLIFIAVLLMLVALQWHWLAWPATIATLAATTTERWLFFAEAEHVSMLYYGKQQV